MDITKDNKKIFTNKIFNGETVSYTCVAFFSVILLIALKQLFKIIFSLSAPVSVLISFIIACAVSYLLEKRFVFRKRILSSGIKQLLMLVFRSGVDFGFYKLAQVTFGNMLDMPDSFVWTVTISIVFFFNYFFNRLILFDCAYNAQEIKQSRIYKSFFYNRFIVAAIAITLLCTLVMYIIYQVFPFGDATVMRMDLYHQYGPLFAELYDRVANHQSFLYSWESGGGSSFLGNFFNYLSSPLSAIIFLFDKEDISFAITVIVTVKCMLSAGAFTYFIKHSLHRHSYISASFGVLYAFCAYFLAYYWNVMWLDAMVLLPFIALGIERIINNGKMSTYVVSLVLLFVSSYYMGFMACIFSIVYFIGYYIISSSFTDKIDNKAVFKKKYSLKSVNNNKFFNRGVRFTFSSLIAAAVCAVTLVPVFFILTSSSATSDTFPKTFESYFNIFDFLTSHLAGLEETIRSSGDDVLPNIYSGIITIILIPLFVINKEIRIKEKAVYIIMLLFFLISFDNNCFNFVWHAMHFPNDLPFRFSYMYSFILLIIGFKSFMHIKAVTAKDIGFVGMAWIFFIVLAQKMPTTKMTETAVYMSLAFVIIWTGYLYLIKKGIYSKQFLGAAMAVFVFCEVIVSDTGSFLITQNNADYKTNYKTYREAIDYINKNDKDFFRTELCYLETRMDPSYYGYNGMSVFSSMAYEDYSNLQYNLGMFSNRINSYTYNTQTPVYNMMFNLKYLMQTDISLQPSENLYSMYYTTEDGKTNVFKNRYHLPIAYCVNNNIKNWDTEEGNPFQIQGDFFSLSTGYDNVFVPMNYIETEFDDVDGSDFTENGSYWFTKNNPDSDYGFVNVTISPAESGNVYLYITSPDVKTIEVNSDKIASRSQSIEEPYIFDIGYHKKGEDIKVSIDAGNMDTDESYVEMYAYTVDDKVLSAGYEKLKENSISVTSFSDTEIKGNITVKENSYLYSSIPYDKGWKIYIDGNEAKTFSISDAMLAASIKPGEHEIVYKYTPKGLNYGIIISAVSVAGIFGYFILKTIKSKNNNKTNSDNIMTSD